MKLKDFNKIYKRMLGLISAGFILLLLLFIFLLFLLFRESIFDVKLISENTALIVISCVISVLLISQLAAVIWSKRITSPIAKISYAADQVAQGKFNTKIDTTGFMDELKSLGNNINKMTEELGSIEVMRSDFVSNVSHEFRAPLSTIQGYVTLLSNPSLSNDKKEEYFSLLQDSTRQLSGLIDNVLKLSRLESQNIITKPDEYSLDEQLRRAVLMFEQQWSSKNLELDLDLPPCKFYGNEDLLYQVWQNLIGNAVKFTPDNGKIGVKISGEGTDTVKVTVSDSGIGMDEETQKHIFEKFYQGDTSHREKGNGLGLALVKTICRLTKSEISVESSPGKGSTFTVTLKENRQ
ncbi:MAG: ATP-binding protein [Acutalibacteraceae bacterium]